MLFDAAGCGGRAGHASEFLAAHCPDSGLAFALNAGGFHDKLPHVH
jgi:hypothetical protein